MGVWTNRTLSILNKAGLRPGKDLATWGTPQELEVEGVGEPA